MTFVSISRVVLFKPVIIVDPLCRSADVDGAITPVSGIVKHNNILTIFHFCEFHKQPIQASLSATFSLTPICLNRLEKNKSNSALFAMTGC